MPLRVGERAPNFDATSSDGKSVSLASLLGKKNVVLYFYPADFTAVCTRETCGFRDAYAELGSQDTEVIGVSVDSDESHQKFAEKYKVPFPLIADPSREIARAYQATGLLGNLLGKTSRVTYVIDKRGLIAGVFTSEIFAGKHVEGARELIRQLDRTTPASPAP